MSLTTVYQLTDAVKGLTSALREAEVKSFEGVPVGSYAGGLLAVVDLERGRDLLRCWKSIVGEHCTALIATGFGDVFFWKQTPQGVYFLESQRGTAEFIDSDADWVIGEFLLNSDVVKTVLRKPLFEQLVRRYRPLKYNEVYILEPWQLLGGTENVDRYVIGDCNVYLDLVGQTLTGRTSK